MRFKALVLLNFLEDSIVGTRSSCQELSRAFSPSRTLANVDDWSGSQFMLKSQANIVSATLGTG